jgi:hypothetical protein
MDFDFRKRCVVDKGTHQVIYYGLTANEYEALFGMTDARNEGIAWQTSTQSRHSAKRSRD